MLMLNGKVQTAEANARWTASVEISKWKKVYHAMNLREHDDVDSNLSRIFFTMFWTLLSFATIALNSRLV